MTYFVALLLCTLGSCSKKSKYSIQPKMPSVIHQSHLSNGWYDHDAGKLSSQLDDYLEKASQKLAVPAIKPSQVKALIAPHAGLPYSGLCAAAAYQTLIERQLSTEKFEYLKNHSIQRVIILAPSHFKPVHGIALPDYTAYSTPLGTISVDQEALQVLTNRKWFNVMPEAYTPEHALEMQLPFLQKTIENFSIVPLIVGNIREEDYQQITSDLGKIINDTTLIVVSSDFVHHGPNFHYQLFDKDILDHVRQIDSAAIQGVCNQSFYQFNRSLHETDATICGQQPLKLLLALLEMKKIKPVKAHLACYYTSAHETANNEDISQITKPVPDTKAQNSVSYASIIFADNHTATNVPQDSLTQYEKQALLACARQTLITVTQPQEFQKNESLIMPLLSPGLTQQPGAFVTLTNKNGDLRGCLGRITTSEPLFQTVMAMTYAAALHDNRFTPVHADEVDNLIIDISILTRPLPIKSYQDIIIGKHGIILTKLDATKKKTQSAVFLPQVPREWNWDLSMTLEQLAQKAGLDKDGWKKNCSFEVFEGFEIKE